MYCQGITNRHTMNGQDFVVRQKSSPTGFVNFSDVHRSLFHDGVHFFAYGALASFSPDAFQSIDGLTNRVQAKAPKRQQLRTTQVRKSSLKSTERQLPPLPKVTRARRDCLRIPVGQLFRYLRTLHMCPNHCKRGISDQRS